MSETSKLYNEIDDYIAGFSDEERQEYIAAETALDLACILYHIRQEQGLTQRQAAERAGLKQQAISRLEKAASNIQLGTLQRYLGALGYRIEISVIDNRTGNVAGKTTLSKLTAKPTTNSIQRRISTNKLRHLKPESRLGKPADEGEKSD